MKLPRRKFLHLAAGVAASLPPMAMTSDQFAKFIAGETKKWAKVIRKEGIRAE
jgi:tripartite-type tricarboxylate transporter receptor subunit TctC